MQIVVSIRKIQCNENGLQVWPGLDCQYKPMQIKNYAKKLQEQDSISDKTQALSINQLSVLKSMSVFEKIKTSA